MLEQDFRTDLLPPQVREFIGRNSHPRQDVAVSDWDELLARTPEEIAAMVNREFAAVAGTAVPYLLVLGAEPAPDLTERIRNTVPRATVEVWDGTGHFPHLAYPARFAERLAATGQWREAPDVMRAQSPREKIRRKNRNTFSASRKIDAASSGAEAMSFERRSR
jgi:hypothetical protein